MKTQIVWNKPIKQIAINAVGGEKTIRFMANEARRLMNDFVPMDTGALSDNVEITIERDIGYVHYTQLYADPVYHGKAMNFQTLHHPLASAYWDKAARSAGRFKILARETQRFIKTKGGG